jgi:hypothetical protein
MKTTKQLAYIKERGGKGHWAGYRKGHTCKEKTQHNRAQNLSDTKGSLRHEESD